VNRLSSSILAKVTSRWKVPRNPENRQVVDMMHFNEKSPH